MNLPSLSLSLLAAGTSPRSFNPSQENLRKVGRQSLKAYQWDDRTSGIPIGYNTFTSLFIPTGNQLSGADIREDVLYLPTIVPASGSTPAIISHSCRLELRWVFSRRAVAADRDALAYGGKNLLADATYLNSVRNGEALTA